MKKVSAWVSAARLRTLPLSVAGIIVGTAAAIPLGKFSTAVFSLALLTTLGLQILSNFANDYGDGVKGTDNEDRVGPARAMQAGLLSEKELKNGMIITSIITLLIACLLIYMAFGREQFGVSLLFFFLGLASIAAAIKYTVGKSAFGYRAMGDIFVFLFFGLLSVMGSFYLYAYALVEFILLPAISIGLLSTAVLNLNNMRDEISDRKSNKRTLVVLLGKSQARTYHYTLIILAFLASLSYAILQWELTKAWGLVSLLAFLPLFKHIQKVKNTEIPAMLDPELKKVALSTFAYSVVFIIVYALV